MDAQLKAKAHPEQACRVCLGLFNLSRAYPSERLEAACRIANQAGLIRQARFKPSDSVADIDYQHLRNLTKAQIARLAQGNWTGQDPVTDHR